MVARILAFGTALPQRRLTQAELRDYFAGQPGTDRRTARLIGAAFNGAAIDGRHTVLTEFGAGEVDPPPPANQPSPRDTAFSGTVFSDTVLSDSVLSDSVLSDTAFSDTAFSDTAFFDTAFFGADGTLQHPSTGVRNDRYRAEVPALFAAAAREALTRAHLPPEAITHVITVSCTGSFAPGPDYLLVRSLGLAPTVARTHIGIMGCAAAFPALRQARDTCLAHPDAVVLVVCAELCSLHLRASSDPEQIVSSAVFADGAAACIVVGDDAPRDAGRPPAPALAELVHFATALTSTGEADMDWSVGDHGFDMRLTANVPRIIAAEIGGAVEHLLAGAGVGVGADAGEGAGVGVGADAGAVVGADADAGANRVAPTAWAVHPGGAAVLDRVETALGLPPAALADSRAVLREHGNMSSATILFILARMLEGGDAGPPAPGQVRSSTPLVPGQVRSNAPLAPGQVLAALCFGPGLTVEGAVLVARPDGPATLGDAPPPPTQGDAC